MSGRRLRRRIAENAARVMLDAKSDLPLWEARNQAAASLGVDANARSIRLPSDREIQQQLELLLERSEDRWPSVREKRLCALRLMWSLGDENPRYLAPKGSEKAPHYGGTLLVTAGTGSSNQAPALPGLAAEISNIPHDDGVMAAVKALCAKSNEATGAIPGEVFQVSLWSGRGIAVEFALVRVREPLRLKAEAADIGRAEGIEIVEAGILADYPDICLDDLREGFQPWTDPFPCYDLLLKRLDGAKTGRVTGSSDWLDESLFLFLEVREAYPFDEEMLLGALLRHVGRVLNPRDPVMAGVRALRGLITPRTEFLIEFQGVGTEIWRTKLGKRLRSQLCQSPYFEDLLVLERIVSESSALSGRAPSIEECLDYCRELSNW